MPMTKKITITTSSFARDDNRPLTLLESAGFQVRLNPYGRKITKEEVLKLCGDSCGIVAGTETLDKGTLQKLPRLKVISRCGTGLESVDMDEAARLGIKVYNTPDAPTEAVAELTVALILCLLRKICPMDLSVKSGGWEKMMGNLLCGKNVGIIGFGRIGRRVAGLLEPFGCSISYCDPYVKEKFPRAAKLSLAKLLKGSDIVSVHASAGRRILGKKEIRSMKKTSWLINVSRPGNIDERELYDALKSGRLAGAALDVFREEPYKGRLAGLKNVILTPHVGSYAREARIEMELQAVNNIIRGFK